jgi:hypothetical protein
MSASASDAFSLMKLMADLGLTVFKENKDWQLLLAGIVLLILWELVWKGIALWYSARLGKMWWFVALLLINSVGLLPIFFLWYTRKERATIQLNRS